MRDCETCKHYVVAGITYGGEKIKCCECWECNYERGMIESEVIGFIQGKLNCMERCDRFDCKNTDECDNCEYCYSQGNFGEQKEAFHMAIKALEKLEKIEATIECWEGELADEIRHILKE